MAHSKVLGNNLKPIKKDKEKKMNYCNLLKK